MRIPVVLHLTGVMVRLFSVTLVVPAGVSALYAEWYDAWGFAVSFALGLLLGWLLARAGGQDAAVAAERLRRLEGLAVVSLTWLVIAHLSAVPYVWVGLGGIDALFEAMSGLTTTGATVLTDFSAFGRGIFFWRSMTQWLGGMGVIALFVAVLPRLAIGGRQLFFAEASGPSDEKLTPQIRQTALTLWKLYAILSLAQTIALVLAGMPLYDAVCHAMTTLAAGGFSPHAQSIAGYQSAAIDWIVVVFMFIAGANFALQYRAVRGSRTALIHDEEFRAYTAIAVVATGALLVFLVGQGMGPGDALRHGAFQALSIMTTTGYASDDFLLWSHQAQLVLVVLMFVGGCAGSAAGGPKVVRHLLMARLTLRELLRTIHPRAVLPVKLGGRVVPETILRDIQVFMLFYLLCFAVGTMVVVALGADLITGLTASIACLGNIGPGLGEVGPMASFAGLHPISKIVLTLLMWIGRLEVITVLVFIRLDAWRAAAWTTR